MNAQLPPPTAWQTMLDSNAELFGDLDDGSRIGFARRADVNRPGAAMVVWEAEDGRLHARQKPFPGYEGADVDVLLVADDESVAALAGELDGDALPALKHLVRRGNIVCYVLKRRCLLVAAGYEDVLDSIGVPFMGACR
jgi:hypothetical protein